MRVTVWATVESASRWSSRSSIFLNALSLRVESAAIELLRSWTTDDANRWKASNSRAGCAERLGGRVDELGCQLVQGHARAEAAGELHPLGAVVAAGRRDHGTFVRGADRLELAVGGRSVGRVVSRRGRA